MVATNQVGIFFAVVQCKGKHALQVVEIESWIYLRVTFSILVIKVLFPN